MWCLWICTKLYMLFITKLSFSFIPKSLDIYLSAVCLCAWGCVCVCAHTGSSSCTTLLWMVLNASHTHNNRRSVSSVSNLTQGEGLHPSVLTQYGTPPSPPLYPPPPTNTHTHTGPRTICTIQPQSTTHTPGHAPGAPCFWEGDSTICALMNVATWFQKPFEQ